MIPNHYQNVTILPHETSMKGPFWGKYRYTPFAKEATDMGRKVRRSVRPRVWATGNDR